VSDEPSIRALVEAWSAAQNADEGSAEYAANAWAVDEFYELPFDDPEAAWTAIQFLLTLYPSDEVILMTGIGPLEALLSRFGEPFIDRVEQAAKLNPLFQKMLGHVSVGADSPMFERIKLATASGLLH
jgi:hypothetical protein